jgi:DNA-binding Xre family transcriptional regulator
MTEEQLEILRKKMQEIRFKHLKALAKELKEFAIMTG